jgi:dolichyl-phosphate beta-glucosyltransferase
VTSQGATPALTLVIPAYNEEYRLAVSLDSVTRFLSTHPGGVELIIVDDGSQDRTAAIACEYAGKQPGVRVLVNDRNRGKGYSIRRGVLEAKAPTVLISDADLSTPLSDAAILEDRLRSQGGGIVIGSRGMGDSNVEVHQNPIREAMGRIFNVLVRALTGLPFQDTQCGFKMMERAAVQPIFQRARVKRFSWDVELLYVAMRRKIPIQEVPVTWRNVEGSKVGILSAPLEMLRDVLLILYWYKQGWYAVPGANS